MRISAALDGTLRTHPNFLEVVDGQFGPLVLHHACNVFHDACMDAIWAYLADEASFRGIVEKEGDDPHVGFMSLIAADAACCLSWSPAKSADAHDRKPLQDMCDKSASRTVEKGRGGFTSAPHRLA